MRPTSEEIRRAGLAALRRELGKAGMIRFMLQFSNGQGDYAKERRAWVDRTSLDEIFEAASKRTNDLSEPATTPNRAARTKRKPVKRIGQARKHVAA